MTNATTKKANIGHLYRAAKKGQLFIKLSYRFDDMLGAADCKNDEFTEVFISPEFNCDIHDYTERQRAYVDFLAAVRKEAAGRFIMDIDDLKGSHSGTVYGDTSSGTLRIHSNLSYAYEIRK